MSIAWQTSSGSLGVIPENIPYSQQLLANSYFSEIQFSKIAGDLPAGLSLSPAGVISGIPLAVRDNNKVEQNVSSKFVVRAFAGPYISDRTFELTVTGQSTPIFVTPAGRLGTYLDSTEINIFLDVQDEDNDILTFRVVDGELPPGVTLTHDGMIRGIIEPLNTNKNFEFVVEVSDSKEVVLRTFNIQVYTRDQDLSLVPEPLDNHPDDLINQRSPFILTPEGLIETYQHDNFYAYKFDAIDFDGDDFEFFVYDGELPPGLQLNPSTGWLFGTIPNLGLTETSYFFSLKVRKVDSGPESLRHYDFILNLTGDIDTSVTWEASNNANTTLPVIDLGTIYSGLDSHLFVKAVTANIFDIRYRLHTQNGGGLPPGLTLLSDGTIAGRPTFNFEMLSQLQVPSDVVDTDDNFVFYFTVNAYSTVGQLSVFREFKIKLKRLAEEPWENIYIKALPPLSDRELVKSLVVSNRIIPKHAVYRPLDPRFGVASNVVYHHAFGLPKATAEEYLAAVNQSHYRKKVVVGPIKTAVARDQFGKILYEVVYSTIIDDQINNQGETINQWVRFDVPVGPNLQTGGFPNGIQNMRTQIYNSLGQFRAPIPLWMQSKQNDGTILGFVPAWVIAYLKPGFSKQVAFNINRYFKGHLNEVDFEIERYIIDRELSFNRAAICETIYVPGDEDPAPDPDADISQPVNIYPADGSSIDFNPV